MTVHSSNHKQGPFRAPLNYPGRSQINEYMLKTINTASSLYKDSLVQTGPLPIITKALLVFASIKFMCAVNSSVILHSYIPKGLSTCSSEPKCDQLRESPVAFFLPEPHHEPSPCREWLVAGRQGGVDYCFLSKWYIPEEYWGRKNVENF